jgi:hypothetical protein
LGAGSATITGALTAGSISTTGTLGAGASTLASATITNALSAGSISTAGTLGAGASTLASATITGALGAGSATITGALTAGSISTTGTLGAGASTLDSATITGALGAGSATITNALSAESISTTSTITSTGGFIGTSYQPSAATTAITFGNNITTGNINIGAAQTTGNLNLGIGTSREATGNIFIGTGASALNTINIGKGNVISIVNSETPTLTINRPITVGYNTSAITLNTQIGFQISDSINNTILPQNSTALVRTPGLTLPIGVWQVQIDMVYTIGTATSQYTIFQYGITTNINGNQASDCIPYARYRFDSTTSLSTGNYFNTASAIVSNTASKTYYGIFKMSLNNSNPTSVATLTTFSIQATRLA